MKATQREIDVMVARLEAPPRRISARTSGLGEAQLRFSPDKQTWSAADILAHLRSCADIWTHSIYAMLAGNEPNLPDINERKWAKAARYAELPFAESLEAFRLQRMSLLRVLHDLAPGAWERPAIILGRKHTVFTRSRRMGKHENEHCRQIESLLK